MAANKKHIAENAPPTTKRHGSVFDHSRQFVPKLLEASDQFLRSLPVGWVGCCGSGAEDHVFVPLKRIFLDLTYFFGPGFVCSSQKDHFFGILPLDLKRVCLIWKTVFCLFLACQQLCAAFDLAQLLMEA